MEMTHHASNSIEEKVHMVQIGECYYATYISDIMTICEYKNKPL